MEPVAMSGTSQATPFVTFAAGLLRSLALNSSPRTLKNRIIASADLLPSSERNKTAFEAKLNIQRSLFWLEDSLEVFDGEKNRHFLGTLVNSSQLACSDGSNIFQKSTNDMFALKKTDDGWYFFGGMQTQGIQRPCRIEFQEDDNIYFSASAEVLKSGEIQPIEVDKGTSNWPIAAIRNLVIHTPIDELN